MTRDQEFLERYQQDRPIYEALSQFIIEAVSQGVADRIEPLSPQFFFKLPPSSRTKDGQKLVEKAFYRSKNYNDPYQDITDKVGCRFVVLLGSDIKTVENALQSMEGFVFSKDRDYEAEQNKNPISFDYAAVHYIVRPAEDISHATVTIPAGTPCEVQIKTLLQHAWSELTHDTLYKPQIEATTGMKRNAAKAMALLEATNDYFEKVAQEVDDAIANVAQMTNALSALYEKLIGIAPSPSLLEGILLERYEGAAGDNYTQKIEDLFEQKGYIADRIRERVGDQNPIFKQPAVLLVYLDIAAHSDLSKRIWPLTMAEMEPLLNDLGESAL